MSILSFNTETETHAAVKQIYIDIVKDAVNKGLMVVNGGAPHSDLTPLTDDQIAGLKICGKTGEVVEMNKGKSQSYATVRKAYNVDKWYIPKPDDQFLANITGYTIQSLPDSWKEPSPI